MARVEPPEESLARVLAADGWADRDIEVLCGAAALRRLGLPAEAYLPGEIIRTAHGDVSREMVVDVGAEAVATFLLGRGSLRGPR